MSLRIAELPPGWIQCPSTDELGGPDARERWARELATALMLDFDGLEPAAQRLLVASFERGAAAADAGAAMVLQRRIPASIAHVPFELRELVVDDGADIADAAIVAPGDPFVAEPVVEAVTSATLGEGVELRAVVRMPGDARGRELGVLRRMHVGPARLLVVEWAAMPLGMLGVGQAEIATLLDRLEIVDAVGETPDLEVARRLAAAARTTCWPEGAAPASHGE